MILKIVLFVNNLDIIVIGNELWILFFSLVNLRIILNIMRYSMNFNVVF